MLRRRQLLTPHRLPDCIISVADLVGE